MKVAQKKEGVFGNVAIFFHSKSFTSENYVLTFHKSYPIPINIALVFERISVAF